MTQSAPSGLSEQRLQALHQASTALATQLAEADRVLDEVLDTAVTLIGAGAALCRWEPESGLLRTARTRGLSGFRTDLKPGVGIVGRTFELRTPVIVNDYPNWEHAVRPSLNDTACGLGVPLIRGGVCVGVIAFLEQAGSTKHFTDDDARIAMLFADQVAVVLSAADALEQQRWAAQHDALTGLENRTAFQERLQHAIEGAAYTASPIAMMMMDLDRFKEINDTLGHQAGDLLLQQIGPRLRGMLRKQDTLARLGGDEFAMLLPGTDAAGAQELAERVQRALQQPFDLEGASIEIGGSIGIVCYPDHGIDADSLLRRADVAMYMSKEGSSGWALYSPERDHNTPERLALVTDLRRAIDRDELVLYYQPQVDVRTGTLYGVEALVRWTHPERGLLGPNTFIQLAEQTRLIGPLTQWAIRAALRQLTFFESKGLRLQVAVNLAASDLQDSAFPERVAELLRECGVAPSRLQLEITEGSLLADPRRARESLARLRALGVLVAIDDFGTGYSSLSYLQRLPVDELKIDRSFVGDMASDAGARAIVRAIIDLADDLGLRVVAEGVEDPATWEVLAALGCDVAQGYYFSPPVSAAELVQTWGDGSPARRFDDGGNTRIESALSERVRDRRARLTAEEEFIARKRAEQALKESEERLRLAIEAAEVATWDWDLLKDRITWSGGNSKLFGTLPDAGDGDSSAFLARVHADDRQLVVDAIDAAVRHSGELYVEHRIVAVDSSVHWIQCKGRVLRDVAGRPVRLLGTDADITERKAAELQRERLLQAEKLRALGQMASGIAHELTQSLLLIAGNGELAGKALAEPQADLVFAREALETMTRAAMNGGETVKRLLTFASSHEEADAELVRLKTVLDEVAQLTAAYWRDDAQSEGRPISMLVEADEDAAILGWETGLQEALITLVLNSVDALPRGGEIRMSAHRVHDQVQLQVTDSGEGMTPEVQARIFEPFFTTKGARGTGLGLAQVFGIVERHQGRVEVDSAPGRGTTVRLILPLAPGIDTRTGSEIYTLAESREDRPLRILAVDDEPLIGKMMVRLLRGDKHVVETASSGEQALQLLEEQPFDVLITDVGMGAGMNGWELAEHARKRWSRMALVLATGWGAAIDPLEARAKGISAVLAKPYRPEELKHVLAQFSAGEGLPEAA